MRCKMLSRAILLLAVCTFWGSAVLAQQGDDDRDRTLSPYFFVMSDDPEVDRLPLKSTSVAVDVSGVIADVRVTQVYENQGRAPVEAVYIFPASTRAAVYGMRMTIGERTIVADIKTREDARQDYEQALHEGRSASLLEQLRPNVFQMNVANILPGDVILVELCYTELLLPVDAVYEFIYPTVVGPRYSNRSATEAPGDEQWIENPYLHEGELPPSSFDLRLNLSAGLPIRDISCESHRTTIGYAGANFATVELDEVERFGGNRDFVCRYRLSGDAIETGLLLYEGRDENFFLLMVQPPRQVRVEQIPPREYIFIVDVSGSMHGFPLDVSKKLLSDLIGSLRGVDRFNVLLFSGGSTLLSETSLAATGKNIRHALDVIDRERGGGGTELLPALKKALALPAAEGCSRSIIIATDGFVSVEKESFDLIRDNLGTANLFSFGIGTSVNRFIIEGMARAGMGEPFVVTSPEEASPVAQRFRTLLASPVLTDISVRFDGFDAYEVEPRGMGDVFAGRPLIVYGKWRGKPGGTIHVQGRSGKELFSQDTDVTGVLPRNQNAGLMYLWARQRIAALSDYARLGSGGDIAGEVRSLGLMYHLLTDYTSFIAVDSQVRRVDGHTLTVKQPLPLPQGVSDYAVGAGRYAAKMSCPASPRAEEAQLLTVQEYDHEGSPAVDEAAEHITIELKDVSVSGALNKDVAATLVEKSLSLIQQCPADEELKEKEVVYTLVVDSLGRVKEVQVDKTARASRLTAGCIEAALGQIRFPSSKDSQESRIRIVLVVK